MVVRKWKQDTDDNRKVGCGNEADDDGGDDNDSGGVDDDGGGDIYDDNRIIKQFGKVDILLFSEMKRISKKQKYQDCYLK